jgi:probable F420-dependent oxidoreductase
VPVKFGLCSDIHREKGDVRVLIDLAREAEECGWDGFFLWDTVALANRPPVPIADPWTAFAAIAAVTERIRFGPMVAALPRHDPFQLARRAASIDQLSGGRLVLGVGAGEARDFAAFGDEADTGARAARLDEALEVLAGLWSGQPFTHRGEHYRMEATTFLPCPVQQPRLPIWVGGYWPARRPIRRAARWDGACPLATLSDGTYGITPEILRELVACVGSIRGTVDGFDFLAFGRSGPGESVAALAEAGATWFVESIDFYRGDLPAVRARIRSGPPHAG